jgi:iron complex outermembrane receptor protein
MNNFKYLQLSAVIFTYFYSSLSQGAETIDEIVVSADFRGRSTLEIPASISVLDADQINQLATQHFEELINVIPNLNWSGDGHRARYFQIRGVGELEQYQGAPNPSVGFLIDDIDFSGIGTIATLFDMERIEVLRGPQGSRYGANALGGLVYMQSAMPTVARNGRLKLSAGDDNAYSAGIAFGGALDQDEDALFRVSAHHHRSDGYRNNSFLGRTDTNGRDETTVRGRLAFHAGESVDINIAAFLTSVDDGYDAFSLDNSYSMLSDKPGKDAQDSVGASLKIEWSGLSDATLTSISAIADSDIEFSFDADWGNDDSWNPVLYDYITFNDRSRRTLSQEFRLASDNSAVTNWLIGVYAMRMEDELLTINQGDYYDPFYDFADSLDDRFDSSYEADNLALFGQLERAISGATRITAGLRVEQRSTDYSDSSGLAASPSESMVGGELALSHDHSEALTSYLAVSKGYKAGGFNLGVVPPGRREFGQEELWNVEAGIKAVWLDNSLSVNAAIFYSQRNDQQVRTSFQTVPGDPTTFVFFTDNAAKGETLGAEADIRWLPAESWEFYANIGLLDASFDEFSTPQVDLSGRAQAHAPNYTLALGGAYRHFSGWFARVDASAKDAFYFDVSHDQKSKSYELVNLRVGFEADSWTATLWARNLFDKYYAVRGFFFGNEPPDFPATLYTRPGDPRQFGITFEKRFGS